MLSVLLRPEVALLLLVALYAARLLLRGLRNSLPQGPAADALHASLAKQERLHEEMRSYWRRQDDQMQLLRKRCAEDDEEDQEEEEYEEEDEEEERVAEADDEGVEGSATSSVPNELNARKKRASKK